MTQPGEFVATIVVKRRGLLSTLLRVPKVYRQHYLTARRGNGRIVSAYIAWLLTRLIVKVER